MTRARFMFITSDFDRSGQDAARTTNEKLERFASRKGVEVIFEQIAVTLDQIPELELPTRSPKSKSAADKNWPYDFACEVDAIPPDTLREIIKEAIEIHMPPEKLGRLKRIEELEREQFWLFANQFRRDPDDE